MAHQPTEQPEEGLEERIRRLAAEGNPWAKFAGTWKDNETFAEFREAIAAHRREMDALAADECEQPQATVP